MSSKSVQQLDRVVIRFAGDSGDGMQLTGDRFTSETAALGNDLSTLPNFPAEIRAPQGTLPGVSLPAALRRPRRPHPGRRPRRAGRDEPGRAQGQPARPAPRRDDHRQHRRVLQAQPRQGRLRREPARGRHARVVARPPGRPDVHHRRGAGRVRPLPQGQGAREEHVRPRPAVLDVPPPDDRHRAVPEEQVRVAARHPRGQPRGAAGRPELRRDHRGLRGLLRDRPREDARRHLPQHHRQRRPRARPRDRGAPGAASRWCSAPTRSPRPPTSCTPSRGSSATA